MHTRTLVYVCTIYKRNPTTEILDKRIIVNIFRCCAIHTHKFQTQSDEKGQEKNSRRTPRIFIIYLVRIMFEHTGCKICKINREVQLL